MEFIACKTKQSLQDMELELQEKEEEKDEKHIEKLFRKSPSIKGVYQL